MSGLAPRVYLHRLGCPKLDVDNDLLEGGLGHLGARLVDSSDDADTVIVSTCAFIGDAQAEAVEAMLEAVRWKEEAPGRKVFVSGCLPARYKQTLAEEVPEVDGWFGSGDSAALLRTMDGEAAAHLLTPEADAAPDHPGRMNRDLEDILGALRRVEGRTTAFLKIAEGCDRRCAYCAIPDIRGSYRSRRSGSILSEAHRLLVQGVKEIIVTAEEVNSWGRDLLDGSRIETLLPKLGEAVASHGAWLRVLYTHPPLFSEEFVQALANTPALVPYLDFPIEHADDRVLKAMGRGTTWESMQHWIDRLRATIDGIALRTSVIVGHPGEGVEEFATLIERLDAVRFDRLGVFRYSPEEGTRAATRDAVNEEEARRRADEVMELALNHAEEWYASRVGQPVEVLIERLDEDGARIGRSVWDAPDVDGEVLWDGPGSAADLRRGVVVDAEPFLLTVAPDPNTPSEDP